MNRFAPLLRIAARNVVRQSRRSALIAAAMTLGVATLAIFLALGDGMHTQWIDAGVRLADGHVTLEAPRYRPGRDVADRLDSTALRRVRAALEHPAIARDVLAAAPRLAVDALASSATSALPVRAQGVDPEAEGRFSALPAHLVAGRMLQPGDRLEALVGSGLAERLRLRPGARFVLTAPDQSGAVQEQLVHVAGVFQTGIREVDQGVVDLPIETVRRWLEMPGAATGVAVLLARGRSAVTVARELRGVLPPGIAARTWHETAPELDAAVRVDDLGNYLFNAILLAIVTLAVLEALLVAVLHRRREFGVLQALGLTARETSLVVLGEGMLLAGVSGFAGLALGLGVTSILSRTGIDLTRMMGDQLSISGALVSPVVHPAVRLSRVWQGAAVVLVLGLVASLYPMWQSTRIDVADAVKLEA
jgi:ABC-type lipoprotein release transport system permease subunit